MALKDITVTGSIGSIPTQSYGQKTYISSTDDQSFPIEQFEGGTGGVLSDLTNITQSWSGSINTPVGIVNFIHNTQEEFYDGEFSGSNLVVTSQRLDDEQTIQLLSPNTTPTNYKPYFYYSSGSNAVTLTNFLNSDTSPNDGELYLYYDDNTYILTPGIGIGYVKIARKDDLGNDNTLSLQELDNFRIKFSDVGLTQYDVSAITEYSNYYLYEIVTKNVFSSTDNNVLNHKLTASCALSSIPNLPGNTLYYLTSSWTTTSDPLNYFNNGIYTFKDTPNIPIIYTASISFTASINGTFFDFSLIGLKNSTLVTTVNSIPSTVSLAPGGYTYTLSGSSNSFIEGINYMLVSYNSPQIFNVNVSWNITQSVNPYSISDIVVLEPYLLENFYYSDSNILINNAEDVPLNNFYRRIIYDNGSVIPSNFQQIISQSAELSNVKDYYYNLTSQILPRYNGVRTLQQRDNQWTVDDIGFGKEPSVQNPITYFLYFNKISNTAPILKDRVSAEIRYLINGQGEVINPGSNDVSYYNLIDSFEPGKNAYAILDNNLYSPYNNNTPIYLSGEFYTPILYNLSASFPIDWSDKIDFVNFDGTSGSGVPSFNSVATPNGYINIYGASNGVWYNVFEAYGNDGTAINGSNGYYDPGGQWETLTPPNNPVTMGVDNIDHYHFTSAPQSRIQFNIAGAAYNGNSNPFVFDVIAIRKRSGIDTYFNLGTVNVSPDTTVYYNYSYSGLGGTDFITGDKIYFYFIKVSGTSGFSNEIYPATVTIKTAGLIIDPAESPFWTTGSANSNVLTGSVSMSLAYEQYIQKPIVGSGFDQNASNIFTIQPNDEFRFEYDENNVFRVTNAYLSGSSASSRLIVFLDKPVPSVSSLNINHFTIRRKVKNVGVGVVLDSPYFAGVGSNGGFLFPQFLAPDIKNNLPNIISNLNERNIL